MRMTLQMTCRQFNELLVNITGDMAAAVRLYNVDKFVRTFNRSIVYVQSTVCLLQRVRNSESMTSARTSDATIDDQCQCDNDHNCALVMSLVSILKKLMSIAK